MAAIIPPPQVWQRGQLEGCLGEGGLQNAGARQDRVAEICTFPCPGNTNSTASLSLGKVIGNLAMYFKGHRILNHRPCTTEWPRFSPRYIINCWLYQIKTCMHLMHTVTQAGGIPLLLSVTQLPDHSLARSLLLVTFAFPPEYRKEGGTRESTEGFLRYLGSCNLV